jgi:hypothetical protein
MIQDQLLRLQTHPDQQIWRQAFEILMPHISGKMFINLYRQSFHCGQSDAMASVDSSVIKKQHLKSILECLTELRESHKIAKKDEPLTVGLINLITDLGIKNPQFFIQVRGELTLWVLVSQKQNPAELARVNRTILLDGFRKWINSGQSEADFDWGPILQFDQNIAKRLKGKIEKIFRETTLIRESTFIFKKAGKSNLKT